MRLIYRSAKGGEATTADMTKENFEAYKKYLVDVRKFEILEEEQ